MGFSTGLSGLNAASQDLDIIGNNVANASTVGFKQSRAVFSDVYAASLSGAGASAIGIGTKITSVEQQFTQGTIDVTNNPLDVAISGRGFFRVSENGAIFYSRNGQFHLDNQGFLVTPDSLQVTGYPADSLGNILQSAPIPIQIDSSPIQPTITSAFRMSANFDSRATPPTTGVFNAGDPSSYNETRSGSVYDSLGNPHVFSMFFIKTAVSGQWEVRANVDGTAPANVDLGAGAGLPVNLQFNNLGALTTGMPLGPVDLTIAGGAVTPLSFSLDFNGSTSFGTDFAVNSLFQDGYTSGRLTGFSVGTDGVITGRYTNSQSKSLAQITLVNFTNSQGLKPLGNNRWEETAQSGLPLVGIPNSGDLGALQTASVEQSNVDLTAELVNMITAQRNYQANAQTIKTQDAILQTLINLR